MEGLRAKFFFNCWYIFFNTMDLICCKLETAFKCQRRISNSFRYKDCIPKDLISGVIYKFQCGVCNESYYNGSIRLLDIRSGEHIGVPPLTGKKVRSSNNSAVCNIFSTVII